MEVAPCLHAQTTVPQHRVWHYNKCVWGGGDVTKPATYEQGQAGPLLVVAILTINLDLAVQDDNVALNWVSLSASSLNRTNLRG
jgi:hypothetical protein